MAATSLLTRLSQKASLYCASHAREALKPTQSPVDASSPKHMPEVLIVIMMVLFHQMSLGLSKDEFLHFVFESPYKDIVTHGYPRNSKEAIQSTNPNQRNYLAIHQMILSLFNSSWAASHWSRGLRMFEGWRMHLAQFFPSSTRSKHRWSKRVPVWELKIHKAHMFGLVKRLSRSSTDAWNGTSSKPQC